jgi:transcriptional regulator with XRE-family HTH domain
MSNGKLFQANNDLQKLQHKVGMSLRALRVEKRLTQEQLAYVASMSTRHIQKIERGELNITLRTIVRLCSALQVEPIKLFSMMEESGT